MNSTGSGAILFIVDDVGRDRNQALIGAMGAACLPVERAGDGRSAGCSTLVVDVDLADVANVKSLRAALTGEPFADKRIFTVDYRNRLEMIYANILGATGILRRPLSRDSLWRHLDGHPEAFGFSGVSAVVETSINSAANVLGNVFDSMMLGAGVDLPVIADAEEEVMEAISESGFPDWLETVRQHHASTFQHCLIVTGVLTTFAQSTGMSRRDTALLTRAGLLHDVGKAAIPVDILDKAGALTDEEFAIIRQHPGRGFDYLGVQGQVGDDILSAVRSHHEYLDGSGYPDGLSGGRIGDVTRIVTICDVFGALIERRAYKPPLPPAEALSILDRMVGEGKLEGALVKALHQAAQPMLQ